MSISIDSGYCNRFIILGRPIFPLNHSAASATTAFTIPTTFGIAHAMYTPVERAAQSATWVGSSLLDSVTVPSTHYVPKIIFAFSPIWRACTNSIAIYLIITRDFIFLSICPPKCCNFVVVGGLACLVRSQRLCQLEFWLLVGTTMLHRLWARGQTKCNTPLMLPTSVYGMICRWPCYVMAQPKSRLDIPRPNDAKCMGHVW